MSISVGSDYFNTISNSVSTTKASSLESSLSALQSASDEEMLESCKEFEAYLVEQMMKGMEKTIPKDEDEEENDYVDKFGDMLYENIGKSIVDSGQLGLAQQLYESMKRNQL